MLLYAVVLNFPSLERRVLAQTIITPPKTLKLALCIRVGSFFMAFVRRSARLWPDSSLQRSRFQYSGVQWRQALHHSSRHLALHMVILGLCSRLLGHGKPFHEAPDEQLLC
jgi:hypothetical protein